MIRGSAPLIGCLLLTGCAATGDALRESPSSAASLEMIAAAVRGDYVSIRRVGDTTESVQLRVSPEFFGAGLALNLSQQQGSQIRRFRLELPAGTNPERFQARFIPLHTAGVAADSACDMDFRLSAGRLVGQTDPDACRFQSQELLIGLLKEIAFEADRVLMADQLMLADGSPLGEPDRLSLARVSHFSGTLATLDGGVWRVARNVQLSSGGSLIEPLDAAGMSLGLVLNLELVQSREQNVPALRLQVIDEQGERVKGEVWGDIDSTLLGLSLDSLRLELQRQGAVGDD